MSMATKEWFCRRKIHILLDVLNISGESAEQLQTVHRTVLSVITNDVLCVAKNLHRPC